VPIHRPRTRDHMDLEPARYRSNSQVVSLIPATSASAIQCRGAGVCSPRRTFDADAPDKPVTSLIRLVDTADKAGTTTSRHQLTPKLAEPVSNGQATPANLASARQCLGCGTHRPRRTSDEYVLLSPVATATLAMLTPANPSRIGAKSAGSGGGPGWAAPHSMASRLRRPMAAPRRTPASGECQGSRSPAERRLVRAAA